MTPNPARVLLGAAAMATAAMWLAPTVQGDIPDVVMSINVNDGLWTDTFNPPGTNQGDGNFNFTADTMATGLFVLSGDINARPDATHPMGAMLGTNFLITNIADETLEFEVTITMPMSSLGSMIPWASSVSYNLSGPGHQELWTLDYGDSLWQVFADDVMLGHLGDHPTHMESNEGQASLPLGPIWGEVDPIVDMIKIRAAFSLTPEGVGGPNGAFGFATIPAPATLVLGGLGLIGMRRRRRH